MSDEDRLEGYNYMKILTDWTGGKEKLFNKDFVWPRQLEVHLPSNKEIACDFHCYYCQGSSLDMSLGMDEKKVLKLLEEIGPNKFEYIVYGGAYTEPLLNKYFMDFIKLTKKNKMYFGIHTNGSQIKKLDEKDNFCETLVNLMENKKDYISISLDGGSPKSHSLTKNIKYDAWTSIIEGIKKLVKTRNEKKSKGSIRVAYLLNKWNSSEDEIKDFIELMKEIKVDSLRFSIPYAQYGKEINKVQDYKKKVENEKHKEYKKMLSPYMSKDTSEKPFVFYFAPINQDVDRMIDSNYKQCAYTYYQITIGSSGHVYRCSSIATPTFDYGIVGQTPDNVNDFKKMILEAQDEKFNCQTCLASTARCNRMALEINTAWNNYNKPENEIAKQEKTIYVGDKSNKAFGKHIYENKNLRWDDANSI
jgi:wyosine [tRNA(Phe)-imidazoG37] synthetase (radical SAM superfamily)